MVSAAYSNGRVYRPARGRYGPRQQVEDELEDSASVVRGSPSSAEFVQQIVRELRIRFYQPKTIKSYRNSIRSFLWWFGGPPHCVTREHVRHYLLYLVDAGAASSTVGNHLAAIRTVFDKFCLRRTTLGLVVPRRPRRLPVVLSREEVIALLQAAPTLRDKLLLGLMYATGLRVSEVVRFRWRDVDFNRRMVCVWQGKGRRDRQVMLPKCYESLLRRLSEECAGDDFLFPGERRGRHISPRTAQRIMQRAVRIAGIQKRATPHSLRHAFATHSFENGCDIRRIQKVLGHAKLETTTIYVKVAEPSDESRMTSPLDQIEQSRTRRCETVPQHSVGQLQLHLQEQPEDAGCRWAKATIAIQTPERPVYFTGTSVRQLRPGFVSLQIPPLEDWTEPLGWLSQEQQQRFEEPAFYELLQREMTRRFCEPRAAPS